MAHHIIQRLRKSPAKTPDDKAAQHQNANDDAGRGGNLPAYAIEQTLRLGIRAPVDGIGKSDGRVERFDRLLEVVVQRHRRRLEHFGKQQNIVL